jgi:predicted RNA-binding Zn-ribbon protein involved in translation (DUF1610 family)
MPGEGGAVQVDAVVCPKCGAEMVRRVAKKGAQSTAL